MESTVPHQVRQMYEVEQLSLRQIAKKLQVSRKIVFRIIQGPSLKKPLRQVLCQPFDRLIWEWYQEYLFLKAT